VRQFLRAAPRAQRAWWAGLAVAANGLASSALAQLANPPTAASPSPETSQEETAKGHGSVSIAYQNTYVDGMRTARGWVPTGSVRTQSLRFDVDYFFADKWSAQLGLPFIEARYEGNFPHCITNAPPQCAGATVPSQPHPESQFLDDGHYHGTWQDWHLGLAYHENVNDYLITPSITLTIPSHDYTFFAKAAAGQGLRKLELAVELAHQLELSNLYYRVRLGRVFAPVTLGQSIDHNRLDLELGYFLDETWTVKVFSVGRKGNGYFGPYDMTTEEWYHHDQRAPHNYASVGFGFDYHIDERYTLSTTVQRLVWGEIVFDFKYSFDVRLTREF